MKRKSANLIIVLILALSMTMIAYSMARVHAEGTPSIATDKADYAPEDIVTINGTGFTPNAPITVNVTRPDGITTSSLDNLSGPYAVTITYNSDGTSDDAGNFTATYQLDGVTGNYTVTATDGTNTAATTFTDTNYPTTTTLDALSSPLLIGLRYSFSGTVSATPSVPNLSPVTLQCSDDGTHWTGTHLIFAVTVSTSSSSFSGTFTPPLSPGTIYYFRADFATYHGGGGDNWGASDSAVQTRTILQGYNLTVATNPSSVDSTTGSGTYASGTVVLISAPEYQDIVAGSSRHHFTGWTGTGIANSAAYSTTVTMGAANKAATANYETQYNVHYAANVPVTVPADEWVISGGSATGFFTPTVTSGGTQYRFVSDNRPSTITAPTTITATYDTYYNVTFKQAGSGVASKITYHVDSGSDVQGTVEFSVWVGSGHQITYSYEDPVSGGAGTQYVLTGTSPSSPKTVSSAFDVTGTYKTQYYITVTSAHDTPTASAWVDQGTDFTASVTSPTEIVANDNQWVCTGFKVDGGVLTAGTTHTFSGVTAKHTIEFDWKQQFYLTVDTSPASIDGPTGEGWYDTGDTAHVSTAQYVDIVPGSSRYRFDSWTGASGTYSDATVVMSSAKTATANYVVQYNVTFAQSGVGIDFSGNIMNVGGTDYDRAGHSDWYDSGASITFSFYTPLTVTANVKQYVFLSSSTSSPLSVSSTVTVTGAYKVQWTVTFAQSGLNGADAQGTVVTVFGSSAKTVGLLPNATWVDDGSSVAFSYGAIVGSSVTGKQYVLTEVSGNTTASSVTVNSAVTVTGTYMTQYQLTVNSDYGVTSGSGWYDAGSKANAGLDVDHVDHGNGTQHVFVRWNGDASGTDYSKSDDITMDDPKTATAVWKTQHYLTVNNAGHGTAGGQGWYDTNANAQATISPLTVAGTTGTQYVFAGWSGDATGSGSPSDDILMNGPKTATATWTTQYYLTVSSAYDTPGGAGWYDSGSTAYATLTDGTVSGGAGTRYVFTGWSGDASGTNYAQSDPITMSIPKTATADWKTQYYLTVNTSPSGVNSPTGADWYDSGATAQVGTDQYVDIASGSRYRFDSWTGATGTYSDATVVMSSAKTATANYVVQYYLTVNTYPSSIDSPTGEGWHDTGDTAHISTAQYVDIVPGSSRYRFDSWTGASGTYYDATVTMDSAKTATANYKTQYHVTFAQSGVGSEFTGTVMTVGGTDYNRDGHSDWYDSGASVTYSYASPLDVNAGKRYFKTSTDASPLVVSDATTVTGTYKTQYYLTNTLIADSFNSITPSQTSDSWYDDGTDVYVVLNYVWDASSTARSNLFNYTVDALTTNVPRAGSGTLAVPKITMTAAQSVSDASVTQYYLKVSTNPTALNPQPTVSKTSGYTTGDGYWDVGSVVSIYPDSPAGYTFDHWSVDASGSSVPLSVTMSSAKTVIAVFRFNLAVGSGFKAGDSPSFASDPYLSDVMCILVKATSGYKLAGTSPGTFDYAIAINNTGTTTFASITINAIGSNYFILQSSNPIRLLDATGTDISAYFAVSGAWPTITIQSKNTYPGLPGSASLYVTVHLDYALKGQVFSSSIYNKAYTFTTSIIGTSGANQGNGAAYGSVAFLSKKVTTIYGFVKDSSGQPIAGAKVELWLGTTLKYADYTDTDGFYCFIDGVNGVTLTGGLKYTVKCYVASTDITPFAFQDVTAQSQTAVAVNFTKPK